MKRNTNSEKPIVFLSHSSKDKNRLIALKGLLEDRFRGAAQFFLSSDGESLPLGKNWVSEISDALAKAKLMFLFLSENSVNSRWVHFEAGYAYANRIDVVPVCLPGLDLDDVGAPLHLLQGFNLHSASTLSNLVEKCNKVCGLDMDKVFSISDFNSVFGPSELQAEAYFGQWTVGVSELELVGEPALPASTDFNAVGELEKVYLRHGEHPTCTRYSETNRQLESVGVFFKQSERDEPGAYRVEATFSPELLHLHAAIFDEWYRSRGHTYDLRARIWFTPDVAGIYERHKLTTKLYRSDIEVAVAGQLKLKEFTFVVSRDSGRPLLHFGYCGNLTQLPLRDVLGILFQRGVLLYQ